MLGLPFLGLKRVAGAVVGQAVSHAVSRAEGWAYSAVGLVAPLFLVCYSPLAGLIFGRRARRGLALWSELCCK